MALVDNAHYIDYGNGSTTGYYGVTVWAALTTYDAGVLRRQLAAPAVGSERVFVVVAGHVASGAAEPTWVITRGGKTTDATITWQECTGIAALNGDFSANTPTWTTVKNTAVTLGQVINDVARSIVLICTTAGTAGNGAEPSWGAYTTAGATTADNTVTWTNIGVVGNFTGWQAPHARLANAYTSTWGQAGNSFFVASEHAETQSTAITLTSPGTTASPCYCYCVTKTAVPPVSANLTTGVSISATGASSITLESSSTHAVYYRGITFNAGSAGNTANLLLANAFGTQVIFELCSLVLNNTSVSSTIVPHSSSAIELVVLINTTITFGSASQAINGSNGQGKFVWKNTASALLGTAPTNLFTSAPPITILEGVDLSSLGSKTIVGTANGREQITFKDCKLGASFVLSATPTQRGQIVDGIRCDSGATNYQTQRYAYEGTQTIDTTIVRTGGATDGTTPISWKIVTTANSKWVFPFECLPIAIWNDITGSSITVTVYGIWGGGAVPNNDEIWIEAEYPGSSSTPQGSFTSGSKADNLASGSALSSDTSAWGGSTTAFKMTATFTPQMKGPITIYVKAAKISSTFYIDPRPAINGVTVGKSEILAPGVYANDVIVGPVGKFVSAQRGSPY